MSVRTTSGAEVRPPEPLFGLCAMNPAAVPASIGTADSARAGEQLGSAVDASLVIFAAMRMPVDGIVIAYTLNPLVAGFDLAASLPRWRGRE